MPRAPRKCPNPGCENRITTSRYCPEHTTWHWPKNTPRGAEHSAWARAVLKRDKRHCQIQGPNCTGVATEADHILNRKRGGKDTLNNGQAVCTTCHAEKTKGEALHGLRAAYGNTDPDEPAPF